MNCVRCARHLGCLSVTFHVDRHLVDYEFSGHIEYRDEVVPASDAGPVRS